MKSISGFFLVAIIVVQLLCVGCSSKIDANNDSVPSYVKVEEFNATPGKCDEASFFLNRMSKEKRNRLYKFKVSFWDDNFSPSQHLSKHQEDVAIASMTADKKVRITILTNNLPIAVYLGAGKVSN